MAPEYFGAKDIVHTSSFVSGIFTKLRAIFQSCIESLFSIFIALLDKDGKQTLEQGLKYQRLRSISRCCP